MGRPAPSAVVPQELCLLTQRVGSFPQIALPVSAVARCGAAARVFGQVVAEAGGIGDVGARAVDRNQLPKDGAGSSRHIGLFAIGHRALAYARRRISTAAADIGHGRSIVHFQPRPPAR